MKKLRKRDKYVIAAVLNLCWYCIAVLVLTAHDKVVPDSLTVAWFPRGRRNWRCWRESKLKERTNDMNERIIKRIANLLSVKSIVTLVLTGVFAYMAVTGNISQDFMTIYAVIIAFYFGTQSQKPQDGIDGKGDENVPQ